ncbi:MAG TPA: Na+/H+ antiporter subunit E [Balneolales bacterium]|nr:Na+/H+ antiporter subunit E [Balneolales bacterium]
MMRYLFHILILFGFWLLFTDDLSTPNLVVGAIVAIISVVILGRYFVKPTSRLLDPKRYGWFVVYVLVFSWECLKANLDVAYRVLHPDLPIRPGIVKVKTSLKTDLGRTTLANSITMTPGTITVDIIDDYIYVHWIYVRSTDPAKYAEQISGRFEKYISRIFE